MVSRREIASMRNADRETAQFAFDPEELRERYRVEREKRLRKNGRDQYVRAEGDFAGYAEDIHADPGFNRSSIQRSVTALIIGGGFGGMLTAARLKMSGVEDVLIVEKGGDFGGTWYWNRYPGAACDTEAYIYLPLLEEVGTIPSAKYAKGAEILAHALAIGRHYDLYDRALFQTEVKEMRWDEDRSLWQVSTSRGDRITARFVISVIGQLHQPKLPGVPGIEQFNGHSFHTSRWDYGYTGGDQRGNLTGLADKRVGIIGTGATAVQCVPHLAASAKHLYVFQRTPSVVDERNNRPTEPDWLRSLKPGWQRERQTNFNILVSGGHAEVDLVNDGWTDLLGKFLLARDAENQKATAAAGDPAELADFEKMEKVRSRVDALVEDPTVAELLKPYYSLFCKRPCFHDEYLQAFNRPNVTLVDTSGAGVERLTGHSAIVNGIEYPLDCLIYATGFEVNTPYTERARFEVYGRNGLSLSEKWRDGPSTLHGFHTHGFPNLLLISQIQGGAAANFTHMLDEQAEHVAYIVASSLAQGLSAIEADSQAEQEWLETVLDLRKRAASYGEKCTPGYYNNEGALTLEALRTAPFSGGSVRFIELMAEWRATGAMPGLIKTPATAGR